MQGRVRLRVTVEVEPTILSLRRVALPLRQQINLGIFHLEKLGAFVKGE